MKKLIQAEEKRRKKTMERKWVKDVMAMVKGNKREKHGELCVRKIVNYVLGLRGAGKGKKKLVRCPYCEKIIMQPVFIQHLYVFHGIDIAEKYGYKGGL